MKAWNYIALCILTSVMLMVIALYNGFPLVDADSAAYIEQAIYPHFTPERTPFYGLFLRVASLCTSLWFVVLVQSAILAVLLLRYITFISGTLSGNNTFGYSLLSVLVVTAFTCVSWITSYLMPDVFTPILLLAMVLFIADRNAGKVLNVLYAVVIFVAIAMHFSHITIAALLAAFVLFYSIAKKEKALLKKSLAILVLCAGFWGVMSGANKLKNHGLVFARGSHVIMMGKLTETGILKKYLKDQCGKKNLKICRYKEQLPSSLHEFLESGESPLYKMGGWDSSAAEYNAIIAGALTTAPYAGMYVRKTIISTIKQLTLIKPPAEIIPYGKQTEPYKKVKEYFTDESKEYATSMQQLDGLRSYSSSFVQLLFFLFTSLWIFVNHKKALTKDLYFVYGLLLLFLVANALVIACFSSVAARFQFRVFWMVPATNAIVILFYYKRKLDTKTKEDILQVQTTYEN